jgi:hypothetical protein
VKWVPQKYKVWGRSETHEFDRIQGNQAVPSSEIVCRVILWCADDLRTAFPVESRRVSLVHRQMLS